MELDGVKNEAEDDPAIDLGDVGSVSGDGSKVIVPTPDPVDDPTDEELQGDKSEGPVG